MVILPWLWCGHLRGSVWSYVAPGHSPGWCCWCSVVTVRPDLTVGAYGSRAILRVACEQRNVVAVVLRSARWPTSD